MIPESFTDDFLSVFSGNPVNPTIEYWVNEKYNAVAVEVTDAGAGVVDAVINRVFSAVVADAMSEIVKTVADDIVHVGGTVSAQTQSGLSGAESDLRTVISGVSQAKKTLDSWEESTADAKDALDALKKAVPDTRESLEDGKTLLAEIRKSSHAVNSAYSSVLAEGGVELKGLLSEVSDRVKKVAEGIESQQADISAAIQKAEKALSESQKLIAALRKADPDSSELADLEEENERLQSEIEKLEQVSEEIGEAAGDAGDSSAAIAQDIDEVIDGLKSQDDSFNREVLPKLDSSLDSLADFMGLLDGTLANLDIEVDQAKDLCDQLDGVLSKTRNALDSTVKSLDAVTDSLKAAKSDLASLSGSDTMKRITSAADIDVKSYGSFMASPVNAEINAVYPLNSYGAGVAPFYTCLAIWVGCFMLIAVLKLEVDPKLFPGVRPWQGYMGRLLLLLLLSLFQSMVVTIGDMILGVEAFGPVSFVVAGMLASFCFINIVCAFAITFKHVGKALAVIFLIVQIPGASGMYPIQLMPGFFQALYPWLPFTYGMGAMREAIGGFYGTAYLFDLAWLLACGLVAIALAVIVRPAVLNLNKLFDRKLAEADVYITEEHGLGVDAGSGGADSRPFPLKMRFVAPGHEGVANAMNGVSLAKAERERFSRRYAIVRQAAPISIVALTVTLAIVSYLLNLDANGKLVALAVFIGAVVAVFCVCIAFEYVNDNQLSIAPVEGAYDGNRLSDAPTEGACEAPGILPIYLPEEDGLLAERGEQQGDGEEDADA